MNSEITSCLIGHDAFDRGVQALVIVAGHLIVRRGERDGYLAGFEPVVGFAEAVPATIRPT